MEFRSTPDTFALADQSVIRLSDVQFIDLSEIEQQRIKVRLKGSQEMIPISGFAAMEFVWYLKPGALEGRRLKWAKNAWAVHNLIAHPVMQLLAFCRLYKWAMWVHDVTVPKPLNLQERRVQD